MKIYIPTSNKTVHLIEALILSLKKYWNNFENYEVIILGYDKPKFSLDSNIKFVELNTTDEVSNWAIDLKKYFESVNDEYFIYMNDDCPLSRNIDESILNLFFDIVSENNDSKIGRICLTKCVSNRPHFVVGDYDDFQLIEAEQDSEYRTSVQFSIWNRDYFTKYAKENMTPWQYELQHDPKNDGYKILGTKGLYCLDFYHLMRKWGISDDWNISCHENQQLNENSDEFRIIKKVLV